MQKTIYLPLFIFPEHREPIYTPILAYLKGIISPSKGGDPAAGSPTATLLRLHPNHHPHLHYPHPINRFAKIISGAGNFRGVTGGVYKVRERIHRVVLIRDY
jgi:hypothetical protein